MDYSVQISGMAEMNRALTELAGKQVRKIASTALREAAKLIQRQAQANAPVGHYLHPSELKRRVPGSLKKAIKVRAAKSRAPGQVSIFAGPAKGFFQGNTFYAGPLEFGWRPGKRTGSGRIVDRRGRVRTVKTGGSRGFVEGFHYVQYAFEERADQALRLIIGTAEEGIEKAAAQAAAAAGVKA